MNKFLGFCGSLLICFPLWLTAQSGDSTRFLNLGFSLGLPHQIAYPATNSAGIYLTNSPLLSLETYNFAISRQFLRRNSWGYGMELGLRKHFAGFSESKGQALFQGGYQGNFHAYSGYMAPTVHYNFSWNHNNMLNLSGGVEVHAAFGTSSYEFPQGTFFFEPSSGFALLRLGVEYRRKIIDNFSGGLYLNITQGLDKTAELTIAEAQGFEVNHLGSYWGTGFEFGLRISMCWECGGTSQ